jgi:hypothetical protein
MPDGTSIARNDSVGAGATAAAPGAGGVVATVAAPPTGYYRIEVWTGYAGTTAAAELTNMELRAGATVISRLANTASLNTTNANPAVGPYTFYRNLNGATALTVNATAAATAASVYSAQIVATKLD